LTLCVSLRRRAEAWALAEKDGRTLTGKGGDRKSEKINAKNGVDLIKEPAEYFGELLGVSTGYAKMARALLQGDPTEAARVTPCQFGKLSLPASPRRAALQPSYAPQPPQIAPSARA
jgi:hypothetical protein